MDDLLVQGNYTSTTSTSAYGGGICYLGTHAGDASLTNSMLGGNANYTTASAANGIGGGLYLGLTDTSFTLDATTLDRNTASYGALGISTADGAHVSIQGGSTISNSVGYGIYQSASDIASDVALTDSSIQGSSSTGWYMSAPRAVGVHASCTGSSSEGAGVWGNSGYGVLQTCTTAASCSFTAVQCDFNDPATGTGNSTADLYANGTTYNYTYDATFACIGTVCL
jgi:hypothetical protein